MAVKNRGRERTLEAVGPSVLGNPNAGVGDVVEIPISSLGGAAFTADASGNLSMAGPTGVTALAIANTGTVATPVYELQANVIPRTGLLADLKALTSGGGELASSTDTKAIVQLSGVAGSGTASVYSPMAAGVWNDTTNHFTTVTGQPMFITQSASATAAMQIVTPAGTYAAPIFIASGNGSLGGGALSISAGSMTGAGSAGDVNINGGNGLAANAALGGGVLISAGGTAGSGLAGSVSVFAGPGATAATDGAVQLADAASTVLVQVGGPNAQGCLGFFSVAAAFGGVTQPIEPATHSSTVGFVAATVAGGTAVNTGSSFTGGVGTSKYTIGDVVAALKALGLLAV